MTDTVTRWFSLRNRLLSLLLGGMAAGWLVIIVITYFDAHKEVDELLDAQMVQVAQTLMALASEYDDDDDITELQGSGHKYQKKFVFQIWDSDGHLLLRSIEAPREVLTEHDGFSDSGERDKQRWRYYSQWDRQHNLRVVVGENHHVRDEMTQHIIGRMLAVSLIGLPVLGLWSWLAIQRGMRPINAVADAVAQRDPEHLDPVRPLTAPREVRPLLESINQLLDRVGRSLEGERRFTADAAHELRTPLAALSAQAQVALRARDEDERRHALEQLAASARRASHLVDQLLTLARLDPAAELPLASVALDRIAAEVCAEHGADALDQQIDLALMAVPATVMGNETLLRILLRNLIDNAIRYSGRDGKVDVGVTAAASGVELTVSDNGPGIPVESHAAVLQRFQRLAGQAVDGSGLGLSIVARIAELHGAHLTLAAGLPAATGCGLCVKVVFRA